MRKLLLGIAAVALLAGLSVTPVMAAGGTMEASETVAVSLEVLQYVKIWVTPMSMTLQMDPANAWESNVVAGTLNYYACVDSSTNWQLSFKTSPRWPDGIWLKIDIDSTPTVGFRGDQYDSTIAIVIDSGTGPKPVTNRALAYHSNVGVGIPAAGVVWTGNFIWTISL